MKGQQMTRRNFCWFTDSGMFNDGFRNRFEAEWNGKRELAELVSGNNYFYTGEVSPWRPDVSGFAEELLNLVQQQADWEAPSDEAVDWLDDVAEDDFEELGQMMQRTFNRWIRKHPEYKLDFFEVENVRGVELHEANL